MRTNDEIISLIQENIDEKGLSMSELARRVGIAKSTMSRYFNKTREFPLNRADDFARALNITPEHLLGIQKESNVDQGVIISIFNKLVQASQVKVVDFGNGHIVLWRGQV